MYFPTFEIQITVRCSRQDCAATHVEHYLMTLRDQFPWPNLPADWHIVDGEALCPAHDVRVVEHPESGTLTFPGGERAHYWK